MPLPAGAMKPLGYIVVQHSERKRYPVQSYRKWIARIPRAYRAYVLNDVVTAAEESESDEHCLAMLRQYRSLIPMAQEVGKPIFRLKPGDGALGTHMVAVRDAYSDFKTLSLDIASRAGIKKKRTVLRFVEASRTT